MKLLIVGAGGYGCLVREIAELVGFDKVDFLDDNSSFAIGKVDNLEELENSYDGTIIAIGDPKIREGIFRRLKKPMSLIHPTAMVSKSAQIGNGCVIEAKAVISSGVEIGDSVFVCAGAVVNHNSSVSDFCQIDCNSVVLAGIDVPKGYKVESCSVFSKTEMD